MSVFGLLLKPISAQLWASLSLEDFWVRKKTVILKNEVKHGHIILNNIMNMVYQSLDLKIKCEKDVSIIYSQSLSGSSFESSNQSSASGF